MAWSSAIYFPYMRVRDEAWLRAAALYWDRLYRFRPPSYQLQESPDTAAFAEAHFLEYLPPARYTDAVSQDLMAVMQANLPALVEKYGIDAIEWRGYAESDHWAGPVEGNRALGWIHVDKISYRFSEFMTSAGLATRSRDSDPRWLGLHPDMAAAYMVALADACARSNQLIPATDQVDPRYAPSSGVEAALRLLAADGQYMNPADLGDPVSRFGLLAIETVIPRGLAQVPVDKILATREALAGELGVFRDYLASQRVELEQHALIVDDEVKLQAFADDVRKKIAKPLEQLEQGLRLHKLETVRALITVQTVAPPVVLNAVGAPPIVAAAGGVAVTVGSAWWQLHNHHQQKIKESPVGYLLSVRKALKPRSIASRMASFLHKPSTSGV